MSNKVFEIELMHPPTDGISSVVFANQSDLLLVSSWDKTVRLYDGLKNQLIKKYEHKAPVLDCAFLDDDSKCFSVGLDRNLVMFDFKSGRQTVLGSHDNTIKCVEYSRGVGLVFTGGWDCNVHAWDPRIHKPCISSYNQPGCKVLTMALAENRLVVGTSGRHVFIYDIRQNHKTVEVRESSLMNQTRCIQTFPDGTGYALSSIEGRVSIEYFDTSSQVQKKKYAFKCHRKTQGKTQTLYPVNAIAFHPIYGTFATGGCDHVINVWDGQNQKRICQYPEYPTCIAALDFNRNGSLLAIASSYTWEENDKEHPPDAVYIRTVSDHEVRPKKNPSTKNKQ